MIGVKLLNIFYEALEDPDHYQHSTLRSLLIPKGAQANPYIKDALKEAMKPLLEKQIQQEDEVEPGFNIFPDA